MSRGEDSSNKRFCSLNLCKISVLSLLVRYLTITGRGVVRFVCWGPYLWAFSVIHRRFMPSSIGISVWHKWSKEFVANNSGSPITHRLFLWERFSRSSPFSHKFRLACSTSFSLALCYILLQVFHSLFYLRELPLPCPEPPSGSPKVPGWVPAQLPLKYWDAAVRAPFPLFGHALSPVLHHLAGREGSVYCCCVYGGPLWCGRWGQVLTLQAILSQAGAGFLHVFAHVLAPHPRECEWAGAGVRCRISS